MFLITGGTGFIGSWLAKVLLEEGHEVATLDLRPSHPALEPFPHHPLPSPAPARERIPAQPPARARIPAQAPSLERIPAPARERIPARIPARAQIPAAARICRWRTSVSWPLWTPCWG